jgi:hypothetical protein
MMSPPTRRRGLRCYPDHDGCKPSFASAGFFLLVATLWMSIPVTSVPVVFDKKRHSLGGLKPQPLSNAQFNRQQSQGSGAQHVLKIQKCRACRLGNHLFRWLSLVGIANDNKMVPCVDEKGRQTLEKFFVGPFDILGCNSTQISQGVAVNKALYRASAFESLVFPSLHPEQSKTTTLVGTAYLQSWRYFSNLAPETAFAALTFKDAIQTQADVIIKRCCTGKTSIAIHIRRSDLINHPYHHL